MSDVAALQVRDFLDIRFFVGNELKLIAESLRATHDGKGNVPGQVDTEAGWTGRNSRHVQTAAAHRFNLGSIRFRPVPFHLFTCFFRQIRHEFCKNVFINGWVFHWGIGKDQDIGI